MFFQVWTVLWQWRCQSFQSFSACGRRIITPSSGCFVCPPRALGTALNFLLQIFQSLPAQLQRFPINSLWLFYCITFQTTFQQRSCQESFIREDLQKRHRHCLPSGSSRIILLPFKFCACVYLSPVCAKLNWHQLLGVATAQCSTQQEWKRCLYYYP